MKTILIICCICLGLSSYSQNPIQIKLSRNANGEVIFEATNTDFCDYFAILSLDGVSNATVSSPVMLNIKPGTSNILKLTPQRLNEAVNFTSFSYTYTKGNSRTKMNESLLYLLPVKEGKNTRVTQQKDLAEFLGQPGTVDMYALSFSMNEGDTVYASRGGVVCRITSGNTAPAGAMFTTLTNSVEVFHSDGSFARYNLFKNNGILVKPGNKINAGDPIGIIDKVYPNVYLGFLVYYLDEKKVNTRGVNPKGGYAFWKPKFVTAEKEAGFLNPGETYSAVMPLSIITQEMTKRESEKFQAGKKKN